MIPGVVESMFIGRTARGSGSPFRAKNLIEVRRQFGEGVADAGGPPGALLRGIWAHFRAGGKRARLVSCGQEPLPESVDVPVLERLGAAVERGLRLGACPLVVLPGLGGDTDGVARLSELPVAWPDPSPLILLDAPPQCRSLKALEDLSQRVLGAGGGRFRLAAPVGMGAAPVQGLTRPGPVSPGALAAGLVAAGGSTRVAGSGLSLPGRLQSHEQQRLVEAGVIVLSVQGGTLFGLGLPKAPGAARSEALRTDESPFGALVEYLQDALSHHVHAVRDAGLNRRVERDAASALGRFFGRGQRGYHVRCDDELNPPEIVARGQLIVEVILAPPLPVVRQVVLRLSVH